MSELDDLMNLLDVSGDVQQARLARLCLAFMTEDVEQSKAVFGETYLDPRGSFVGCRRYSSRLLAGS